MAAKTPDSIKGPHSMGDHKLIRATFSTTNLDDGDTWTTTIPGITDYWFTGKNNPTTQASTGIHASFVASTGVFTFWPGEDNWEGTLFIMLKS